MIEPFGLLGESFYTPKAGLKKFSLKLVKGLAGVINDVLDDFFLLISSIETLLSLGLVPPSTFICSQSIER